MSMPHKNVIRQFMADGTYHCYNRGVEKRQIFMDEMDYGVFLNRLKQMLSDPSELEPTDQEHIKSYFGDITLITYCLMPNHFHLLLHQQTANAIAEFMRTLSTSYTMYFNQRYDRVGPLFQGRYKAKLLNDDAYWQHISRYIHLNPYRIHPDIESFPYSSMQFMKTPEKCPSWLHPQDGMGLCETYQQYREFVYTYASNESHTNIMKQFSLDS